jgi:hypothetical protein
MNGKETKFCGVWLKEPLAKAVDEYCAKNGISRSELLRNGVRSFLGFEKTLSVHANAIEEIANTLKEILRFNSVFLDRLEALEDHIEGLKQAWMETRKGGTTYIE